MKATFLLFALSGLGDFLPRSVHVLGVTSVWRRVRGRAAKDGVYPSRPSPLSSTRDDLPNYCLCLNVSSEDLHLVYSNFSVDGGYLAAPNLPGLLRSFFSGIVFSAKRCARDKYISAERANSVLLLPCRF